VRCQQCGDLIGVYEPVIVRDGDAIRETSRIAEPSFELAIGEPFHRNCFIKLESEFDVR
jgi:hypothetical protein